MFEFNPFPEETRTQMVNSSCKEAADHVNEPLDSGIIITREA